MLHIKCEAAVCYSMCSKTEVCGVYDRFVIVVSNNKSPPIIAAD